MKRLLFVPVLGFAALALAAPARAQSSAWLDHYRPSYSDAQRQTYYDARRVAYDNGYREGLKEGEKDARKREARRWQDEKTWQHADKGYRREYGDFERYRQAFRTGYSDGYSEAYNRYAPGYGRYDNGPWDNGRYGDGRAVPRRDGTYDDPDDRNYPNQYPGRYPNQYPGGYGQYGGSYGYDQAAFDNGARDGYEKGVEDARKGRSYDPLRHDWYRSADRNYDRQYGTKDAYRDVYRQGFKDGYERGYRGGYYR
jgi:flagellar biosynthesis/type III secretory pathway protein FliH